MRWFRKAIEKHRWIFLAVLSVTGFFMVDSVTGFHAGVALAAPSQNPGAPPSPPDKTNDKTEPTSPAQAAELLEKADTDEIPLLAGWNLISIPLEPPNPDPATVFAPIAGALIAVEHYAACDPADPWKSYDPADPATSDLTAITPGMGLWVNVTTATLLPIEGALPAATAIELCEGWNHVAFPTAEPRHPHAALSQIAGKWQRVFGYDAFDTEVAWEVFDPAIPDWANDMTALRPAYGYWLLVSEPTTLTVTNQGPLPTIAIAAPADLAVITQPIEVTGTVDSDRLESWVLTSRPIDDGDAVTLATGTAPVSGTAIATFDPTLLLNGLYELELTATDGQGQQVSESIAVAVEGQMKIGHFTLSFIDLAVPVSGLDIEIVRTYDSRDRQRRDFGVAWNLDIRQGSYRNNRPPGEGWQLSQAFVPCDTVQETKSHLTVVRLSDQEVYRFALRLGSGVPSTGGGCFADARFDFVDGPLPGTTLGILGDTQVFWANGSNEVVDVDTLALFEPEQVRLTTRDGRIFDLELAQGVTRVEDLNGNELEIDASGIRHSSGREITFSRDADGRIETVTDPLGRPMTYGYDVAGDLVIFTDRAGAMTRFTYDGNHRLLEIEDPRGVKPLRNEYDASGRLVRHIDAYGKVIELGHDLENRREVVTNRLGASRVLEYDSRGNVVRETDELGKVTTRVFDGRDQLLSETDPLGRMTVYSYSVADDLETLTNGSGNVTRFSYNGRGQLLTVTDPRGGVTAHTYDERGNLTRTTDALAGVTAFTYDATGNLLTTTDALGQASSFQYDHFGNLVRETDELGHEALFTYDSVGNLLSETRTRTVADGSTETLVTSTAYDALDRPTSSVAADGAVTSTVYDLLGKVIQQTDPLGRTTVMTYDLMGRLVTTSFSDGTTESRTYDAEGHLVAETDRGDRGTTYAYDAAGQLLETTYPDGSTVAGTFDAAGQVTASTDGRGHVTTYTYDVVGRLRGVTDALGHGPSHDYDANGNRISSTDGRGHVTTYVYDALDRLTTTTHPDGSENSVTYDVLGRRVAETDPAGHTTRFGYDALGRLTTVTDALNQVTSYTYDELGHRLTQTDANGHTTRFEYGPLGRKTARVLADGSRESMSYNPDGTLASHIDFNGAVKTFQYDANQRLSRRVYPDGSEVAFTYTPTGQRASATDSSGTTTYSYDARDRLLEKTAPEGHKLSYGYDSDGHLVSLAATVGSGVLVTTYAYDAQGRIVSVTDAQGGVSQVTYDVDGNRTSLTFPNDVETTYAYDALGRLSNLATATSVGEMLQSYAYTLGASGRRSRIDEHDGTSRRYEHDALYRLTQDRVADAAETLVYQRDYGYDPVGNRATQTIEDASGSSAVTSTYDNRDRLLSAGGVTLGWDDNGNLTSRIGDGQTAYAWDAENRLLSIALDDDSLIETVYDPEGHRVRTDRVAPDGASTSVEYLVDASGLLSHVVAEISDGQVRAHYTRLGDRLISVYRPETTTQRYYHLDGLGSVRLLTDSSGNETDRYIYSAFGELLEHSGSDSNPYRFAGEPHGHETDQYYNRARWLDTTQGRFLSSDPFSGFELRPLTLHPAIYANLDPVSVVDPSGLVGIATDATIASNIQTQLAAKQAEVGFTLVELALTGGSVSLGSLLAGPAAVGATRVAIRASARILTGFKKLGLAGKIYPKGSAELSKAARKRVWDLHPFDRGPAIEWHLRSTKYKDADGWFHVGAEHNGFFPIVDFWKGKTVVSVKTLGRKDPSTAIPFLERHIKDLRARVFIGGKQAERRILDLRVRPGTPLHVLENLQERALRKFGVEVVVRPFL